MSMELKVVFNYFYLLNIKIESYQNNAGYVRHFLQSKGLLIHKDAPDGPEGSDTAEEVGKA